MSIVTTDVPVTPLRQRMQHDMMMRGLSRHTQQDYIRHVRRLLHSSVALPTQQQPKISGAPSYVSHDLRTPIQRLQLRASLIDNPGAREAMAADIWEMEHFIESTLSYFRSGDEETPRLVDLAAIVMTAVDGASDLGAKIEYSGPDAFEIVTRPLAMKRVIANLIDNARRHAQRIVVSLHDVPPDGLTVEVDDDGPGIPAHLREEALLPFRRLEVEPGQRRGGAGLGLAIAGRAMIVMGGSLALVDSPLGGLKVRLVLPG